MELLRRTEPANCPGLVVRGVDGLDLQFTREKRLLLSGMGPHNPRQKTTVQAGRTVRQSDRRLQLGPARQELSGCSQRSVLHQDNQQPQQPGAERQRVVSYDNRPSLFLLY